MSNEERAASFPIVVNNADVGYLILTTPPGRSTLSTAEQNFLDQLRLTFVYAAVIAGILGIVIGLVVSRTLAAPLDELANAARAFAARDWKRRVKVGGTDEIAQVAREFNQMANEIERAETLRKNLMADVAHELRTPLAVLQGNLRAMLDGVYPLEHGEIATLYDETRLLSRLVDDLRELALADAGKLPLNVQAVDATEIVRATIANFSIAAETQSVALSADIPNDLPHVQADPDRLAQILRNLLANALRHTPGGQTISVQCAVFNSGLKISVRDTGEGIASEDLPHVFDRFYRADKTRARASGGSGLGLAIVKAWVEAMGGKIGVESEQGKGSLFWFSLEGIK
jgi:two-component system OmpR family sensor kinase/two-component system sensor histidine kinase BaeS